MISFNPSSAAWPGLRHFEAAALAAGVMEPVSEPGLGTLSHQHSQLVPQCRGVLTEDLANKIRESFPGTQYRLHANVRVLDDFLVTDLSTYGKDERHDQWFKQAHRVHEVLGASAYSAHAGRRANATLEQVFDNTRRLSDQWGCTVAVEGLYPTREQEYLLSTWREYAQLLDSGVDYALDVSHLNIVLFNRMPSRNEARMNERARTKIAAHDGLFQELLASEHCVEIHVSGNDGSADQHAVLDAEPWWMPRVSYHANPNAVVFSEGNQLRWRRKTEKSS